MLQKNKRGVGIFFEQGIKKFKTHGALFPSSRFLGLRILKHVDIKDNICIVELGAGTGVFTQQILKKLPQNGRLIIFEINPSLVVFLKNKFKDNRILIVEGDARNLKSYLDNFSVTHVDCIISGIPLGNLNKNDRQAILSSIKESLGKKGVFLQFQYLMASYFHVKSMFNTKIVGYEYRNFPPAFIYRCSNK